jgi:hypothetical protein
VNPEYPVYVISKGRHEPRSTSRALEKRGIPYRIVVEPQEHGLYASVIDPRKILTLPFGNLGQGSIPARNWVWEHSIREGHAKHWILDDNISHFGYLNRNTKHHTTSGTTFRVIEVFSDRYENLALSGMQYEFFLMPRRNRHPPVILNTRVYSCILVRNDIPYRWRGRYNEDTDLSLRALKGGWCTVLFNAFYAKKVMTMSVRGGNTDELYRHDGGFDGRLAMAHSLRKQHPDVVRVARRWGRWQHVVDYRPFRGNKLRLRPGIVVKPGVDNFGLVCRRRDEAPGRAEGLLSGQAVSPGRQCIAERKEGGPDGLVSGHLPAQVFG